MSTRRTALLALACAVAGLATGCGDSVDTSGNLSKAEEEANQKTNEAMQNYAKQNQPKKRR